MPKVKEDKRNKKSASENINTVKKFRSDRMISMRKSMHLSQKDIAYLCNIDRETIAMIESDLLIPTKELFKSLKMVLRSNSQYLLNLSDNPGKYWIVKAERIDGNHFVKLFVPRC